MKPLLIRLIVTAVATCACSVAQIQLSLTTSPGSLQIDESSRLRITLMNTNAIANTLVRNGDTLRIFLDLGDAAAVSLDGNLILSGRKFKDRDWTVDASTGTNPVTLMYQGDDQLWPAMESVAVSLKMRPASRAASGAIVLRIPGDGRYGGQEWQINPINIVSAELMPRGEKGATGDRGPAGQAGAQGPTGLRGSQGADGPEGPRGAPGRDGATGPQGPIGATGLQGPAGPQGVPGALAFYGDGSDGPLTISSNVDWNSTPPSGMLQFSSFTVTPTGSLALPSGLVIRVAGNVSIAGPITVSPGTFNYGRHCYSAVESTAGTPALSTLQARFMLRGPAMANAVQTLIGGGIVILSAGPISITGAGSIRAPGLDGRLYGTPYGTVLSAASPGGIVTLGSRASITNAGTIMANGGKGGAGDSYWGAGGGGGGGIIHFFAPFVVSGSVDVSGGTGGGYGGTGTFVVGGACGGSGGSSNTAGNPGGPGGTGQVFTTITSEPAAFFVP